MTAGSVGGAADAGPAPDAGATGPPPTVPLSGVPPLAPGEPPYTVADPHALLGAYLDFLREAVLRKLEDLPEEELRRSRLPSGWTPLQLLRHLTYVELRWLCWGFDAEQVPDPWGDEDEHAAWHVPDGMTSEEVLTQFRAQCARSRAITAAAPLDARARTGGRFPTGADGGPPTLAWILCHLFQEYARHAGHLDVARELADGTTGE